MKQIRVKLEFLYTIGESVEDWSIEPQFNNGKEIKTIESLEDAEIIAFAELESSDTNLCHLDVEFISSQTEIEKAKQVLKDAGYFTDILWNVTDVQDKYKKENGDEITDNEAQDILYDTLTNEWVVQEIWNAMGEITTDEYIEKQ